MLRIAVPNKGTLSQPAAQMLSEAGLDSIAVEHVVLRRERGNEVQGLLASARRPVEIGLPVDGR